MVNSVNIRLLNIVHVLDREVHGPSLFYDLSLIVGVHEFDLLKTYYSIC